MPGALDARTGGTRYDMSLAEALRDAGADCVVKGLAGIWPGPDSTGMAALADALAHLPADGIAVVDGLCLAALADLEPVPRFVALMHHPADLETGLSRVEADRLRALEGRSLARAERIVATSGYTARLLADDYGVAPARVGVVVPGLGLHAAAMRRRQPRDGIVRILAVASVTPRKGYEVLADAAAQLLRKRPALPAFRIDCFGSTEREPELAGRLRVQIAAAGLEDIILLHGEADDATLVRAYGVADLFVHAAHFEGYGMAVADALAVGLPVVAAAGGAVAELVPHSAGLLVPPGDSGALAAALAGVIGDAARREALAAGAHAAGRDMPDWATAATRFIAECRKMA